MSAIVDLFKKIGYEFADTNLLQLALSHRSVGKNNNERLEFLGDSILGFIIAEELFSRFPGANEGELSRFRAGLVKKSILAEIARELDLSSYLILGTGELKSGGATRESILADALEAVISAIYVDAGLDTCRQKLLKWFVSRLDKLDLKDPQKDAKTRLQEYLQSRKQQLPRYQIVEVQGKDHEQTFSVSCKIQDLDKPVTAQGYSRREAEQQAAEMVLARISHKAAQ